MDSLSLRLGTYSEARTIKPNPCYVGGETEA